MNRATGRFKPDRDRTRDKPTRQKKSRVIKAGVNIAIRVKKVNGRHRIGKPMNRNKTIKKSTDKPMKMSKTTSVKTSKLGKRINSIINRTDKSMKMNRTIGKPTERVIIISNSRAIKAMRRNTDTKGPRIKEDNRVEVTLPWQLMFLPIPSMAMCKSRNHISTKLHEHPN